MNPLFRAILEDPEDDTLRLVYADWLEEHGEALHGEFIRVQVELADVGRCRWPGAATDGGCFPPWCLECRKVRGGRPRAAALRRRERELLHEYEQQWIAQAFSPHLTNMRPGNLHVVLCWAFRCGFVESVSLPTAAFLKHARALFAAAPITEVKLSDLRVIVDRQVIGGVWRVAPRPDAAEWPLDLQPPPTFLAHWYSTEEAVREAVGAWCVAYGRRLAGLPELKEE